MAETPAPVVIKCDGCPRHYDDEADLAPARVGTAELRLCRRCYHTALGAPALTFEQSQDLAK